MNLKIFAGFQACTGGELSKARVLQALINLCALVAIFLVLRKVVKINNLVLKGLLIVVTPIFIYVAFVIIYTITAIGWVGLCSGSPGLWQI